MSLPALDAFLARPAGWWTVLIALCLLLLAPLLLVDVPPILDYPNHLARLFILAHADDPVLSTIWRPHWAVIPDLAIDVIGPPLMRVMDPFAAGKIILALALLLPLAGAVLYSRAAFGERLYWPMTAGLMAYNLIFILGFLNYLMALGGALMAAALWLSLRDKPAAIRAAAGAACACALFFVHLFGVAFFGLLAGAAEADRLIAAPRAHGAIRGRWRSGIVLTASFAGPLILWTLVPPHGPSAAALYWSFISKLFFLPSPFEAYRSFPGLILAVQFFCLAGYWLVSRACRVSPGLHIAALAILATIIGLPYAMSGGAYVDSRVPIMLALTLAAGIVPPPFPPWVRPSLLAVLGLTLIFQIMAVGGAWRDYQLEVAAVRRAILPVTPGSKVLEISAAIDRENPFWLPGPPGAVALSVLRTDHHLAALIAIDRRAFWPLLFSDPSQHPIAVQPPYAPLTGVALPADLASLALARSTDPFAPAPYLENWPANFDFVLVLDAGAAGDLANFLPDKLTLLNQSKFAALFRVRKAAGGVLPDPLVPR